MNRSYLKQLSRSQLIGNWPTLILITLAYSVVAMAISLVGEFTSSQLLSVVCTIGSLFISIWAFIAFPKLYLRIIDKQYVKFKDTKVNKSLLLKSLGLNLLIGIVVGIITAILAAIIFMAIISVSGPLIVTSVLLIIMIPLIIFDLAISMVPFILVDKEHVGIMKSISLSIGMMKGYKWKLFVLYLSFMGWAILSIFTLGIGFLWLSPYIGVTTANFYKYLDNEYFDQDSTK